jgi:hypothetical protein
MSVLTNDALSLELLNFDKDVWENFSEVASIDWPESFDVVYATSLRLESGIVGEAYDCSFALLDLYNPTGFTIVLGELPDGLTLESLPDNTCRIYGTPTTAGFFKFTIRASNAEGAGNKEFSLHVLNATGGGNGGGICLVF